MGNNIVTTKAPEFHFIRKNLRDLLKEAEKEVRKEEKDKYYAAVARELKAHLVAAPRNEKEEKNNPLKLILAMHEFMQNEQLQWILCMHIFVYKDCLFREERENALGYLRAADWPIHKWADILRVPEPEVSITASIAAAYA